MPRSPSDATRQPLSTREGMTLVEVIVSVLILTGVVLVLGSFSASFARANSQSHLLITANQIAARRLDELHTQPTYASVDGLATAAGSPDSIFADNTWFREAVSIRRVGGTASTDSVDYKLMTVTVTSPLLRKTVAKTTAIAAF